MRLKFLSGIVIPLAIGCQSMSNLDNNHSVAKNLADLSPKVRFEKIISSLESTMTQTIGDQATEDEIPTLASGGIRNDLFRIQNLAEIYEKRFPSLGRIRVASKTLEDRVGAYREATEKLDFAKNQGADAQKIASLTQRVEVQKKSLVSLLADESWNPGSASPVLAKFRMILGEVAWDGPTDDKRFLYSSLCNVVKLLDEKKWDMSVDLDDVLGLHTLKKEVRWHRIEISMLENDILSKSPNNCANTPTLIAYDESLERNGQLGSICEVDSALESLKNVSEDGKCQLSSCYLTRIDELYSLVSRFKDEAEGLKEIGKPFPPGFLKPVQEAIDTIKKEKILRMIGYELKSCGNKSR